MLDDGLDKGGFPRKVPVRRSAGELAKSYNPVQMVASVARRHGIVPSQLSGWRSAARAKVSIRYAGQQFADVSIQRATAHVLHDGVEVVVGTIVIRLPKNTPPKRVADIAQRLVHQT